jgi:hypothetical protein
LTEVWNLVQKLLGQHLQLCALEFALSGRENLAPIYIGFFLVMIFALCDGRSDPGTGLLLALFLSLGSHLSTFFVP